ncbi:MAG TPA: hypothetical protein VFP39_16075 [Gemmatimonadales bacterium]|nr:hypothetical protein [Gemmatimonadales bacterium]
MRRVVAALFLTAACAPATHYHMPSSLHGYAFYVPGTDSLSAQLGAALRRHGFVVLPQLKGGSGPTAAVVTFVFREPGDSQGPVLHVRLADTRTGAIVGAATAVVAQLPAELSQRAEVLLDSLGMRHGPPFQP